MYSNLDEGALHRKLRNINSRGTRLPAVAIAANEMTCGSPNDKNLLEELSPARRNRGVHRRRAWLVPFGFGGLQRATGRESKEPNARGVRKSPALNVEFGVPEKVRKSTSWRAESPGFP